MKFNFANIEVVTVTEFIKWCEENDKFVGGLTVDDLLDDEKTLKEFGIHLENEVNCGGGN